LFLCLEKGVAVEVAMKVMWLVVVVEVTAAREATASSITTFGFGRERQVERVRGGWGVVLCASVDLARTEKARACLDMRVV
jgi:hypothetical protein